MSWSYNKLGQGTISYGQGLSHGALSEGNVGQLP